MQEEGVKMPNYGKEIYKWQVPEFDKHFRPQSWYILASGIAVVLLLLSLKTANFLFAVIIIIATLIIILHDGKEPDLVDFSMYSEGIMIGKRFYDYDELKNFSVIFKPSQNVKNLYFEFNGFIKPRLSIPLMDMNPLQIRETLLKYIKEDLERTDQPVSEGLANLLKL
ncbi:TPA: hypothetical protein DDY55_04950 [Candidatus Falkowbacteria bacterium]|nr:hypothetical protein [Candidatus Falkowbacteria bacterium]HAY11948.1 hypothetical protein [Candidatus Falkowbacteria bacterium]HAY12811.1 hypothetical protein [Candidatus Falkowbacteria bacterium]HBI97434.1 hypothetical protein [Candidatus Falkowbacteria bacterium]HBT27333.1 hypothetical protein [Candidatus Falkowbacteria bacterium]